MSARERLAYHDAMQAISQTILCAAITGATDGVLDDCVGLLHTTALSCGGRPLRTMTDRVLAQFATPDAAAGAAAKMQAAIGALPPLAGAKLDVRIAFHSGPVTTRRSDPTVKQVLRLVARAKAGQVLTTQRTAGLLSTSFRAFSRRLRAAPVARSGAKAGIYEVISRQGAEAAKPD
jgi:adenylate cyclase